MLKRGDVVDLLGDQLIPQWQAERGRLDRIDDWYHWRQDDPPLPRGATQEHKRLVELSKTPWLNLVVTTIAQAMFVNGYRSPESSDMSTPWRTWNANDFDARQVAVHRAALAYGYSFTTVLPGSNDDGSRAVLRGVSPRAMYAVYQDPVEDDWPMFAVRVFGQSGGNQHFRVYDEEAVHFVSMEGGKYRYLEWQEHGTGVCPVIRYANQMDLDGALEGEVEPFIGVASRINKTAYDRLLTQHYNSWKVRTIAGLGDFAQDQGEADQKKLQLRQDDILVAEDHETRFGTLDETPLDGFIGAERADIESLAAVSQTPSHNLTGQMVNLSAEALAAARAPLTQKIAERQLAFGKSHAQMLRLAAFIEGDEVSARDVHSMVTWQDMEVRSMSQAVDALGKASQMLGIPPAALWSRIPGVTKSDVDEWEAMADEGDPLKTLSNTLEQAQWPDRP